MSRSDVQPVKADTLHWDDVDGDGTFLILRRGDQLVGEVYPRGEEYRWHCKVSDRRQMETDAETARANLTTCVRTALQMVNGPELDELLHHLMVEADRPGRARIYALLAAASQFLRPGSEPDADAELVADPAAIAREFEAISGLEEARTSDRDDALITDLREMASVLWSRISR